MKIASCIILCGNHGGGNWQILVGCSHNDFIIPVNTSSLWQVGDTFAVVRSFVLRVRRQCLQEEKEEGGKEVNCLTAIKNRFSEIK